MIFTEEMLASMKKVEAAREANIALEPRRLTAGEKTQLLADYHPDYHENLLSLDKYLNEPKNEGIEDIYWELAGSGDPGESSQLLLIGMMTDKADVLIEGNAVKLKLYKELL
jgi:hypothetical protein